jgi:TonB family protein
MEMTRKLLALGTLVFLLPNLYAQAPPPPNANGTVQERPKGTRKAHAQIQIGRPIQIVDPDVPGELRDESLTSVFSGTLTTMGMFLDVAFAGGNPELKDSGIDAISQWRYSPCTADGTPVDVKVYIMIDSDHGNISTSLEADPPYPTEPQKPIEDQISAGELFRAEPGYVESPSAISAPDPEYSELARKAKYQGKVVVGMIIGADGTVKDVWIIKKAGLGLDQNAIETLRNWKFHPGTKDGVPVAVLVNIHTEFHLY